MIPDLKDPPPNKATPSKPPKTNPPPKSPGPTHPDYPKRPPKIAARDPRWAVARLAAGLLLLVSAGSLETGLPGAALGVTGLAGVR